MFKCRHAKDLPSFHLLYGGYWFEVLPEDYLIEVSYDGRWCAICIIGMDVDYWILGDAFMRGWYNIHDHEHNRMGFVPFTGSSKSLPEHATSTPTAKLPDTRLWVTGAFVYGIPLGLFLLIIIIVVGAQIWLCCYCFKVVLAPDDIETTEDDTKGDKTEQEE